MIRNVSRIAAPAVGAVVSLVVFGGPALAGDPVNQDGPDGEAGTATVICEEAPPPEDGVHLCTARPGEPGAGGQAVDD